MFSDNKSIDFAVWAGLVGVWIALAANTEIFPALARAIVSAVFN